MPVEEYAYVAFYMLDAESDFDPDELTARLGIEPTRQARRGADRGRGRVHRHSSWEYGSHEPVEVDDWDTLVSPVLAAFEGKQALVRQVCIDLDLGWALRIVTTMKAEPGYVGLNDEDTWGIPTPGSCLSAETIRHIADLGLSLDADMYVWDRADVEDDTIEPPADHPSSPT